MKRELTFEADHGKLFESLHLALRLGRSNQQSAPGKATLRAERDIYRTFEAISMPDPKKQEIRCTCGRVVFEQDTKARVLRPDGGTVVLTQAEVELLQDRIDKGFWSGDTGFDMADALDFLGTARERKE